MVVTHLKWIIPGLTRSPLYLDSGSKRGFDSRDALILVQEGPFFALRDADSDGRVIGDDEVGCTHPVPIWMRPFLRGTPFVGFYACLGVN